jgi:CO/xanthine dehydrogenase FAD-binding subunit
MKAAAFGLVRAESVEEVLAALEEHGDEARVIAGGQSLGPLMALRLAAPEVLVDLARVPGLDRLEVTCVSVRIGAMVRQRTVEHHADLRTAAPLVAEAVPHIGHSAIRSQGTVCGSLAHADPAAELPAVALASGAVMHLRSATGVRTVAAADFFTGYYSTALQPDEILEAVEFPALAPGTGTAFVEFSRRHGDFALVGVAASMTLAADGTITAARIALTGVASTPWLATAAADLLLGASPDAEAVRAAAEAARRDVEPGDDLHGTAAYRRHLAAVLTARALTTALGRAQERNR